MYLADWIKEVGKKYLEIIQEEKPLFLGELQVTKEELSELFRRIRQCHSVDQCDETRASLAVAAVHAAVQASEEDNSYVSVFFRHLDEAENVAQWNYEYGPGILRFLVEHFEEVERPGAFRYACLRSYGSQFKWNLLKRGPVARWLEQLTERRVGAGVS